MRYFLQRLLFLFNPRVNPYISWDYAKKLKAKDVAFINERAENFYRAWKETDVVWDGRERPPRE